MQNVCQRAGVVQKCSHCQISPASRFYYYCNSANPIPNPIIGQHPALTPLTCTGHGRCCRGRSVGWAGRSHHVLRLVCFRAVASRLRSRRFRQINVQRRHGRIVCHCRVVSGLVLVSLVVVIDRKTFTVEVAAVDNGCVDRYFRRRLRYHKTGCWRNLAQHLHLHTRIH